MSAAAFTDAFLSSTPSSSSPAPVMSAEEVFMLPSTSTLVSSAVSSSPLNPDLLVDGVSVRALLHARRLNLTVCPENVYSQDQIGYRVYANMPISIFGILANILNIVIFSDCEMRTMLVNHFLLALSITGGLS